MSFWTYIDNRTKGLNLIDIVLIQLATICFTILVIKFAPRMIIIGKWWFISTFLLSTLRPLYVFLAKG